MGLILSVGVLVAGCNDVDGTPREGSSVTSTSAAVGGFNVDDVDDSLIAGAASTWMNQLGLAESDTIVWRDRIQRACNEGVWLHDVGERLAEEFIAIDLSQSVRAEGRPEPTGSEGASALWAAAAQVCGQDHFPADALAAGPPAP